MRRLSSAWPIVILHDAHREPHPDWAAVTQAIAQNRAQTAWVWRPHDDLSAAPAVEPLDVATGRWVAALDAGKTLGLALDSAGESFDFGVWL